MRKTLTVFMMIYAMLLAVSVAAKAKTYDIRLSDPTEVGDTQLSAGAYQIAVENSTLLFYSKGKEVANVKVRIEELGEKNQGTSLTLNTAQNPNKLTTVRLQGTKLNLVLEDGDVSAP